MKRIFLILAFTLFNSCNLVGQVLLMHKEDRDSLMLESFLRELMNKKSNCNKIFDAYFSKDSIIYTRLHRESKQTKYYIKTSLPKMKADVLKYGKVYKLYPYNRAVKELSPGDVYELDEVTAEHTYVATMFIREKEVVWKYFVMYDNKILTTEFDKDMQSILRWW